MRISFLGSAHGIPAVKHFTDEGVHAYPLIKNWNSTCYEVEKTAEGLRKKLEFIQHHAELGDCMLKGFVTEPLVDQSRAGKVNRDALTDNILFDIDGVRLPGVSLNVPLDKAAIQVAAERIIQELPDVFHNVSYIVHASSSMGMKGDRICLHMDFALSEPVLPQALKNYIIHMNFALDLFESNFTLSASGTALRYPLDRTVADNSHIIYLGAPIFDGDQIQDPIPNKADRTFLVEKANPTVDLTKEIADAPKSDKLKSATTRKVNELRALAGLPERKEKTRQVNTGNGTTHVVINPEACQMTFAADNGDFVAYNINGGDSAGYYVLKYRPEVVRNFKGEPNFLFEQADPGTYQWHLDTFIGTEASDSVDSTMSRAPQPPMPLVFRDLESNAYYNALLDSQSGDVISIHKAGREALPDFMAQYGGVMPENVPVWDFKFDPQTEKTVDFANRFINKYIPSPYMAEDIDMPAGYKPLNYDNAPELENYAPYIADLVFHTVGRDHEAYAHFVNWLAYAFQTNDKIGTAWILQGTQGTGKGVLFDHVLAPLVGRGHDSSHSFAPKVRIENLEDQFNSWMECALFCAFDEFRIEDSQRARKLFNKIKSMITEPYEPVRGMRENLRTVRTFTNFLFFSNDQDVMFIPEDDRRFNVAPRQETQLMNVWPELDKAIQVYIPNELPYFAQVMRDFECNQAKARSVLKNQAKAMMSAASRTTIDDFVHAVVHGDFEYFLPVMDMKPGTAGNSYVIPAQLFLKGIMRDWENETRHRLTIEELRILYCAYVGNSDNSRKFGKLMNRAGLPSTKMRVHGRVQAGYEIQWNLGENTIEELQALFLDDRDIGRVNNITPLTQDAS